MLRSQCSPPSSGRAGEKQRSEPSSRRPFCGILRMGTEAVLVGCGPLGDGAGEVEEEERSEDEDEAIRTPACSSSTAARRLSLKDRRRTGESESLLRAERCASRSRRWDGGEDPEPAMGDGD